MGLGLGAAHSRGIVHRDVKPQNIMLNDEGLVKLTDFGIASMYKDAGDERLTTTGMTLGTVQYYAPEQAQGEVVTPAADIYALGIVMYEMVAGTTPFDGDTPVAVAMRHIQDTPEPPASSIRASPALERIILRCLEKDPRDRYRDGDTLAYALDNLARSTGRRSGVSAAAGGRGQFVSPGPRSDFNAPGPAGSPRYGPPPVMDDYEAPLGMGTRKQGLMAATAVRSSGSNGRLQKPDERQRGGAGAAVIVTGVVILLFVSCFLAAQLAGLGSLFNPKSNVTPTATVLLTTIPDFTGKMLPDAQTLAQQDHLQIIVNVVADSGHPKNEVTAQNPPPNQQVPYSHQGDADRERRRGAGDGPR